MTTEMNSRARSQMTTEINSRARVRASQASFAAFSLLLILQFATFVAEENSNIYVSNKCPFTIWPAVAPNIGHPVLANGGFYLPSGQTLRISAPPSWTGRIWARTGCNFGPANWQQACQTGDCDGHLACNGLIGNPPVTLVEISLASDSSKLDFYDVSLVDGYNLPVGISPKPKATNCYIGGCLKNLNNICPQELMVKNQKGEVVACKSACLAFNLDLFCCKKEYGRPDKCKPSTYSKIFKDACPSYFSYAYDSNPTIPLVKCNAKEYVITFCPSKWGVEDDDHMAI